MSVIENSGETVASRRIRERFEAIFDEKYGDLAGVMRAILEWRTVAETFRRPYNHDLNVPVTEADIASAETSMLAAIRQHTREAQTDELTDEMLYAGYDAMRDPQTNLPAPWIVLGTASKVFDAMRAAAPLSAQPKLTDAQIDAIWSATPTGDNVDDTRKAFARAIEAASIKAKPHE